MLNLRASLTWENAIHNSALHALRLEELAAREAKDNVQQPQPKSYPSSTSRDLLCSHLCHQVKGGKASVDKVLLVPSHFDGVQPVSHSGEGGVIWDGAVQERLGDAEGQESHRSQGAGDREV